MAPTEPTAHDRPATTQGEHGVALVWRVKASLLDYVHGLDDGEVDVDDGATWTDEGFVFPLVAEEGDGAVQRFGGCVTLRGHSGMMLVELAEPSVTRVGDGWRIDIADPDAPSSRMPFAEVPSVHARPEGGERGTGATLTEDGAALFFGPYEAGTPLDDPAVVAR